MNKLAVKINNKTTENFADWVIVEDRKKIKKRINYLQKSLLKLSFYRPSTGQKIDRVELYENILLALTLAKKTLQENKKIASNRHLQDGYVHRPLF